MEIITYEDACTAGSKEILEAASKINRSIGLKDAIFLKIIGELMKRVEALEDKVSIM